MPLRDPRTQLEAAEEMPLLTESAVVTDVAAMDHNRHAEVVAEMLAVLDQYGSERWREVRPEGESAREHWIGRQLDPIDHLQGGTPLNEYLAEGWRSGAVGEKLAALQGRYLQPYPSLLRITVETDEPVAFVAGQYLSVHYEDVARVYSVASSPTRDEIEFCVRRVPGGRMTSEMAVDLGAGDEVTLRGPYGDLVLQSPSPRDVVFLATGTGVAPLKSMVDYLHESGGDRSGDEPRDVWLFLGAAWEDTLPYAGTFQAYDDDRENFHFVPTLSRESYLTDWEGETDYVQFALAKYLADGAVEGLDLPGEFERVRVRSPPDPVDARLDPASMDVYACGIDAMVYSLVDAVERLGVPDERVEFEGFG